MHPIEVGLSNALTVCIVVKNKPFLMKLVSANELNSPINHFELMKVVAEIGLAPKILYLNSEEGIFITNFIESELFP